MRHAAATNQSPSIRSVDLTSFEYGFIERVIMLMAADPALSTH
jgi:hypothetical protein